jgi:1-acyl-sn-glycerol-3-phosphate acyltransferase
MTDQQAATGSTSAAAPAGPGGRHTAFGRCLYAALWVICRTLGISVFGVRTRFAEPLPKTGGLLVLSSHQSHLDPLLLGLACDRRLSSLARASLYKFKPFGYVITALDAVPIDREASALAGMKTVIRRLEGGAAVILFPEGTRTRDGQLGDVKGGFAIIARRAGVPIVPAAIVGAHECWPRTARFPRPGRIRLEFGSLLSPAAVAAMDDEALVAECTRRLTDLDARCRAALGPPFAAR